MTSIFYNCRQDLKKTPRGGVSFFFIISPFRIPCSLSHSQKTMNILQVLHTASDIFRHDTRRAKILKIIMNGDDDVDVDVEAMAFGKKLRRLALQKQQYTYAQLVISCIQCPGEKHAILMERLCGKTSVLHTQGLDTLTLQIQHCVLNEDENEDDVDKSKQQQQRRLEVNAFFEVLCCIHEQRGFSYLPLQPSLVHECFCYLNMTDEETKNHQTYRSYLTGAKDASLTFKHNDVIRICCNYLRTNKAWLDMGKVFQYITKLPLRDLIIAIHNSLVWGGNDKQHTTAASKQKRQPSTTTTTTIGNSCALTYQEKFGIYIVREYKLAADLPDSHMGVNDAFLSFLECVLLANLSLCVDHSIRIDHMP